MNVTRFVPSLAVCVASVLLLASAVQAQSSPNVTTWHYDNNRTGWQQNETILTPSTVTSGFGKIFQLNVKGAVYAQPLAVYQVSNSSYCPGGPTQPCNMVFVVTEQDMLYAFNADYTTAGGQSPAPLWSIDLAGGVGGTYLDCSVNFLPPCSMYILYPDEGVTSTPVIDVSSGILYVVSMVHFLEYPDDVEYYIHAIDYRRGVELANSEINPTFTGNAPAKCATSTSTGTLTFDASEHFQRAALLLLSVSGTNEVFVPFTPADGQVENGWLLAYTYNGTAFSLTNTFVTTPYGTGGGLWMSSAGPASDGTYIYLSTANGTFDRSGVQNPSTDYGDSLLKLTSSLTVNDYFTPADVFSFDNNNGRCAKDEDFGSGGVTLFPDSFVTGLPHLMLTADKESKLYVVNRDNLTGYNSSGDLIVQELTTPSPVETGQGYWGSPAYYEWATTGGTTRAIYYSVDAISGEPMNQSNVPLPMNMYILIPATPNGPIPGSPSYSTDTVFCGHGGAPTVSSAISAPNTGIANTGIVWAIEAPNTQSPLHCAGTQLPAVLHAYNASNLGNGNSELYNSSALTSVNYRTKFSTPMVFNGKVYMGTQNGSMNGGMGQQDTEVDVFGLCGQAAQPQCMN